MNPTFSASARAAASENVRSPKALDGIAIRQPMIPGAARWIRPQFSRRTDVDMTAGRSGARPPPPRACCPQRENGKFKIPAAASRSTAPEALDLISRRHREETHTLTVTSDGIIMQQAKEVNW